MTREEAIAIIENEKKCVNRASKNDYCNRDCYNCELVKTDAEILEALDMAIKALESKDVLDKIRVEIEQLRLHKAQFLTNDNKVCIDSQAVLDLIDKYKAESGKV